MLLENKNLKFELQRPEHSIKSSFAYFLLQKINNKETLMSLFDIRVI